MTIVVRHTRFESHRRALCARGYPLGRRDPGNPVVAARAPALLEIEQLILSRAELPPALPAVPVRARPGRRAWRLRIRRPRPRARRPRRAASRRSSPPRPPAPPAGRGWTALFPSDRACAAQRRRRLSAAASPRRRSRREGGRCADLDGGLAEDVAEERVDAERRHRHLELGEGARRLARHRAAGKPSEKRSSRFACSSSWSACPGRPVEMEVALSIWCMNVYARRGLRKSTPAARRRLGGAALTLSGPC